MRRSCRRGSRPAARGTPFPSRALIPGDVRGSFPVRHPSHEIAVCEVVGSRRRLTLVGTVAPSSRHVRRRTGLGHDPAEHLLRDAGSEHGPDPAVPVPSLGGGERLGHPDKQPGVFVNAEPGVVAVGGCSARYAGKHDRAE